MVVELLKATVGIAVLLTVWLAVQRAWQGAFRGNATDGDALAGRTGCHGCSAESPCETPCEDGKRARAIAPYEER